MKKRSFTSKFIIGILSLSLMLIPVTSMAENSTAAGTAGAGGIAELSMAAKVGIAAAVAAAGIAIAVATDEDEAVPVHTPPAH